MTAWTREAPEAGKRYWLISTGFDGKPSKPYLWRFSAVSADVRDWWCAGHTLRSVAEVPDPQPPPLPEGEGVP